MQYIDAGRWFAYIKWNKTDWTDFVVHLKKKKKILVTLQ